MAPPLRVPSDEILLELLRDEKDHSGLSEWCFAKGYAFFPTKRAILDLVERRLVKKYGPAPRPKYCRVDVQNPTPSSPRMVGRRPAPGAVPAVPSHESVKRAKAGKAAAKATAIPSAIAASGPTGEPVENVLDPCSALLLSRQRRSSSDPRQLALDGIAQDVSSSRPTPLFEGEVEIHKTTTTVVIRCRTDELYDRLHSIGRQAGSGVVVRVVGPGTGTGTGASTDSGTRTGAAIGTVEGAS